VVFIDGEEQASNIPSLIGGTWRFSMAAVQEEEGDNRRKWASVWSRAKDVAFSPYLELELAKK
jgi:hypothetical protein